MVLFYSTDGGMAFPNRIGEKENTGGSQTYLWTIPNNINSTKVLVKAEWRSQPSGFFMLIAEDTSDYYFSITPGVQLQFTEVPTLMSSGSHYLIKWGLYDGIGVVGSLDMMVRYRVDGTWGTWTALGGGYYDINITQGGCWFNPRYYEQAQGQLRIRAWTELPGGSLVTEADSIEFDIRSPWIQLIYPNGGEALVSGQTCSIRWATAEDPGGEITGIAIEYSVNAGADWIIIAAGTGNDFVYDWTVPAGDYDQVRVKVIALYSEFAHLANDSSDGDIRIIPNDDIPSVSLINPNPYVPGSLVYRGGEVCSIEWSATCFSGGIYDFRIFLSLDNGTSWSHLMNAPADARSRSWTVSAVDTFQAKIRIELELFDMNVERSQSVNPFYIFTETVWNRPPLAEAPETLTAWEGETVTLDGSLSSDPDHDPLLYLWEQVDSTGFSVTLSNPTAASPTFIPSILDYEVVLIFRLTVSDGQEITVEHYVGNIKCTSVRVLPIGPTIGGFTPGGGWEGTQVCINGTNLMGAQITIGGVLTATVPTAPTTSNPDPDNRFNFTLVPGIPTAPSPITVTNSAGMATSTDSIEVYPRPWYCLDYGFNMRNTAKSSLSYPWLVWENGDYRRTFGNDVYISLWICLGLPYWTPWDGWECWGYLIDEPICPDPLAAIFYGAGYWYLARSGECFGFSAVTLQLYHDLVETYEIQPGVYDIDDFVLTGALRERVDYMQGSQVSAECLHGIIGEHLGNLAPSIYMFSGMGMVLYQIEEAVSSGDLGTVMIVEGTAAHAMVPYAVVDMDSTHTRIYVWDINKPEWSTMENATVWLNNSDERMNHPPYIEIDKSGYYWEWSYYTGSAHGWWGGNMGLTFLPSDVVLGDRTLPTTLDGVFDLVFGCASGSMEDEEGNELAIDDDGTWIMGIENATPLAFYADPEEIGSAYYLPPGNYTTNIVGNEEGRYNCTVFSGARAAYAIENAEGWEDSRDTLGFRQLEGNPFMGIMTYETSDERKEYSATQIKRFGKGERVYKIVNATIFEDTRAVINTTADYNKLIFFNDGPHSFKFDVEFQGNVICHLTWDELNGTLEGLPTCRKTGIEIGPYETLIIYPSNWTDLIHAQVIVEGGSEDGDLTLPLIGIIGLVVVAAVVLWFFWRRKKEPL